MLTLFLKTTQIFINKINITLTKDLMEELKIALEKMVYLFERVSDGQKIVFTTAEEAGDLDRKLLVSPSFNS